MAQTFGLKLLLISAAAAAVVACGGSSSTSKTPGAAQTSKASASAQAGATTRAGGQTASAGGTNQPPGTPGTGGPNTTPGQTGSAVAGASPSVQFPNITVLPNGTATNSEGTPVVLPTVNPNPAPTGSAATTPGAQGTAAASGAKISIVSPAGADGDFDVDVKVEGVAKPFVAFNVYMTFDPAILSVTAAEPGTALSASQFKMFCAKAPDAAGTVGLGCTVVSGPSTATNGVLAKITFHKVGTGTARLHLRTVAEGAASGTYIATPRSGAQLLPDIVTLVDASVTVS